MPYGEFTLMLNTFSIKDLIDDIADQISKGWESVNKLQNLSYYLSSDRDYYDEEHDMTEIEFGSQIERLDISMCAALEALGLHSLLSQYKNGFSKFEGKFTDLQMLPYIGEFHSKPLGYFWRYHKTISALIGKKDLDRLYEEKRKQLESILINTPKIVKDRGVDPSNEAEVRNCVYDLLIHIFHDTVREIPIVKETKTYKPDLGVKSLKTAAEYKFADSAKDVKSAVGGLYEDMRGYSGSEDWTYFYAVVYMTDAFYTPEQIMSEFNHTNADDNWKPILVFGKGSRKKRTA